MRRCAVCQEDPQERRENDRFPSVGGVAWRGALSQQTIVQHVAVRIIHADSSSYASLAAPSPIELPPLAVVRIYRPTYRQAAGDSSSRRRRETAPLSAVESNQPVAVNDPVGDLGTAINHRRRVLTRSKRRLARGRGASAICRDVSCFRPSGRH
jgi:hypothetical protein